MFVLPISCQDCRFPDHSRPVRVLVLGPEFPDHSRPVRVLGPYVGEQTSSAAGVWNADFRHGMPMVSGANFACGPNPMGLVYFRSHIGSRLVPSSLPCLTCHSGGSVVPTADDRHNLGQREGCGVGWLTDLVWVYLGA